jgi:3-oxoacyl-[acyl-carrier-protein] synthase II
MLNCLRDAGLKPGPDVDGVNMHGTSTPLGDLAESKLPTHVLAKACPAKNEFELNAKSMTAHLLGAAGHGKTILSFP